MSKLVDMLKKERIKFVIPYASKLKYTGISKTDTALVYTIDKGYLETYSMDTCYYLSLFLRQTQCGKFIEVGNIEKIILSNKNIVYRQRFYFTDFPLLLRVIGQFNGKIVVPDTFRIGIQQMTNCIDAIPMLDKYFSSKCLSGYSLDEWLTDCCLVQVYMLSKMDNVFLDLYKSLDILFREGILNRAPYLSGVNDGSHTSIVVPPSDYLYELRSSGEQIDLLNDELEKRHHVNSSNYKIKYKGIDVPIYGFTKHNIELDKEYL